jgi:hypothetical protein
MKNIAANGAPNARSIIKHIQFNTAENRGKIHFSDADCPVCPGYFF